MNELNNIIEAVEQYINATGITNIDDFAFTRKLTNIILNQKINDLPYKFNKKIPFEKTIKIVDGFFKSINEEYSIYFNKRLNDGTFIFEDDIENKYDAYSEFEDNKRIIYIPLNYNLYDSFSIVHELLHDMNIDESLSSYTRMFYTEGISFLGEILLDDYLKENKIKDSKIPLEYTLTGLKYRALQTDYNLKLLEKRINDGYLNQESIIEVMENYNPNEINYLVNTNIEIIENKELTLDVEQTYIYGFLLAVTLYRKIKQKNKNIKEFFELNEIINLVSFNDVLDYLDLPYYDGELTIEGYKQIEDDYKYIIKSR